MVIGEDVNKYFPLTNWELLSQELKPLDLLHAESKLLAVTRKMLSERKVQHRQHKSTKNVQHRLFTLWDELDAGRRATTSLLKACSYCYV